MSSSTRPTATAKAHLTTRPPNWKSLAPAPLPGPTFAAQPSLPQLPVPSLPATLARLKESLKPLARSEEEYKATVAKIDAFGAGKGAELHTRLLKRREEAGREHWLEEWWDDLAYLGYRDSVVVNVSYYYGFAPQPAHLPQTSAARAAALTRGALLFRHQLQHGLIPPDATREGALCMDTYRWMFDCARVPGAQGLDWSISHANVGGKDTHIVVFRSNRPWRVDVTRDGEILSFAELEKQFQHIYDTTDPTQTHPPLGLLPASNRDTWAASYTDLVSSPQNASIVASIHSAAFCVSLDAATPAPSSPAHARALWHGADGGGELGNRWVDKPVQFVVFDNGVAGLMGEHSVMDGTPTVRLCDEVLTMLEDPSFALSPSSSSSPAKTPEPMDWHVSPSTATALRAADGAARELVGSQALSMHNTAYGKAAIKAFGVSPDAWAQMVIQLAHRRLSGAPTGVGTYEAATTRKFRKGRTEAIRVLTPAADAWVRSMDDPLRSPAERRALFGAAAQAHIALAKDAGNAEGVDRHLLGLKLLLGQGEEVPAVYGDELVKRGSYWVLSTSAIFSRHFVVYGWGEVVPDGFGVAYMTGFDDHLQFTITSRTEMPNERFQDEITKAAVDLYDLHAGAGAAKPKL